MKKKKAKSVQDFIIIVKSINQTLLLDALCTKKYPEVSVKTIKLKYTHDCKIVHIPQPGYCVKFVGLHNSTRPNGFAKHRCNLINN